MSKKMVDVERVIGDKNPRLLKILPRFVIRYLKRILHQEEINSILSENQNLKDREFCHELIERFKVDVRTNDMENIPKSGGVILACNHPLGGMDAIALVDQCHHYRPDMKFIVNDILLNLENLKGLFVGVNKHGANAVSSLAEVNSLFESDKAVFIFPAGLVSRKSKGKVTDLEWKKTFVTRARKYGKPVVPVYIDGHLSNFFYRFANLRKGLGIKSNLEMLYLADEQFNLSGSSIEITFGKPIEPDEMNNGWTDKEWTAEIRRRVYALKTMQE